MKLLRVLGFALAVCSLAPAVFSADIHHIVQKGDTLYHLSRIYGVPVEILQQVNNIPNARSLKVGSMIEIPQTYQVQKGDTLYSIAKDNGVRLSELLSYNHIRENQVLTVGQILVLPPGATTPAPPTTSVAASQSDTTTPTTGMPSAAGAQDISMASGNAPFWPATGRRTFLTGKLAGGTQIAGEIGDPVYAVAGGRVVWVGPYRGYGRVVFVESPSGYIYVYGGNETTLVKVGENVAPGTQVANMGVNPHLGRACAYFFVYHNGKPLNPQTAPRG